MTIDDKIVLVTRLALEHANSHDQKRRAEIRQQVERLKAEIKAEYK